MFKSSLLLTALSCSALLQAGESALCKPKEEICCPKAPKHMRAAVRHIEAGGVGYNHGYTTLEAFLASDPYLWDTMPFLDIRGHVFNTGKFAANVGIGARSVWGDRVYGVNAYYDYRNGHHKGYSQVSAGLETLGKLWDLRFNGYFPVGGKVSRPISRTFDGFSGNSVLVSRKFEYSMTGVDGELGFHFGKTKNFDFYAAAGSYYFTGHFGKAAIGAKARVAAYYKEYVTLELSNSYDAVFHDNVQGQLTLSLPFGPKTKSKYKDCNSDCNKNAMMLANRMVQPVVKQEIVVLDNHRHTSAASDFFVFVNNLSSSAGTFESPYPTLLQAQQNSKPGDIIYVFPGDGTTTGMDAGIVLQDDQKLWGSGVGHTLSTNLGTIYIPVITVNSPQITNTAGNGVDLATNNDLSGLIITGTSQNGIAGTNPGNLSISSSTISYTNMGYHGVNLSFTEGTHNVEIDAVEFANNPNLGLNVIANINDPIVNVMVSNSVFAQSGTINISGFNLFIPESNNSVFNVNIADNLFLNTTGTITFETNSTSSTASNFSFHKNSMIGGGDVLLGSFQSSAPIHFSVTENTATNCTGTLNALFNNTGDSTLEYFGNNIDNIFGTSIGIQGTSFLHATVHGNTFSNSTVGFQVVTTDPGSSICLDMVGNTSVNNSVYQYVFGYGAGTFNLTPCNIENVNTGMITYVPGIGSFNFVESCASGAACPP